MKSIESLLPYRERYHDMPRDHRVQVYLDSETQDIITDELIDCAMNLRAFATPSKGSLSATGIELGSHTANRLSPKLELNGDQLAGNLTFWWTDRRQSIFKYAPEGQYWTNSKDLMTNSDIMSHLDSHLVSKAFDRVRDSPSISSVDFFATIRDISIANAPTWSSRLTYETADYSGLNENGQLDTQSIARMVVAESSSRPRRPLIILEAAAPIEIGLSPGGAKAEQSLRYTVMPGQPSRCDLFIHSRRADLDGIMNGPTAHTGEVATVGLTRAISLLARNKSAVY